MFLVATTHVCKLLLQRISSYTDALNKSHGLEASYITVHSYDILVINTRPQTHVITKISYCDICNLYIHTYIHTYMHTYIHTYMYARISTYSHIQVIVALI